MVTFLPCENLHCNTLLICLSLCESVYGRFSTVYTWLKLMCLMSKYCLKRVLYQDQRTAWWWWCCFSYLLLLLSHFSRVLLCATPSLGFSRQEHWSGLPFPSPMHKSESEVAQSCPTLRYPMDCSLPGSSIHGIFQARVLEWGAIAFSDLRGTEIPDPGLVNLKTHILHHSFVCPLPKEMSLVNITVWPVFLSSARPPH